MRRWPLTALLALGVLAGCSSSQAVPQAGMSLGRVPSLRGAEVMLLPVQDNLGIPGNPDAEIAFALEQRSDAVEWILPDELGRAAARSPTMELDIYSLAVGVFLAGEVRRIGDPLYRDLLRLSALTGADLALLPVQLRHRPTAVDEETGEEVPGAVEILAALVQVSGGNVLWTGILDGAPGDADDPAALATMADRLARRLVP